MDMVAVDLIQEPICISKGVLGRSPGGKGAAADAGGGGTMEAAGSGGTEGRAAVARASGGGSKGWEVSAVGGTNSAVGQTETVNFESVA